MKYKAIRIRIYLGKNEYYPRMLIPKTPEGGSGQPNKMPCKINGQAFANNNASAAEWKKLVKNDDWNEFVYDLEGCGYGFSNCSEFNQVQFRPLVNMSASGMSGFRRRNQQPDRLLRRYRVPRITGNADIPCGLRPVTGGGRFMTQQKKAH